jgi:endonuclease-3
MEKREIAKEVMRALKKAYPDAPATYLDYENPFELLIATILSARATDVGVNKVTPILFGRFPSPNKLGSAGVDDVADIVRPLGAYNKKAAYITETAQMLAEIYGGVVPQKLDELIKFKGVSRKTANVILSVAFDLSEGVVVDTHVGRVTVRLGLSEHDKKPDKIEKDLMEILPKKMWNDYARLIGAHGRRTCKSQRPKCPECSVNKLCPSAEI